MRPASVDARPVSFDAHRAVAAACACAAMLCGGCALQVATGSCDKPARYWEAGANIVIAPPAGQAEPASMHRLGQINGMIQAAAASVGSDYTSSKVIRLVPARADDPSCRPEAIRYLWSGCASGTMLIRREPVTVIWPFAQPAGEDDTYLRFSLSNWIVGGSFDIDLNLTTAEGRKYRLEATVPVENVAFRPRRVSRKLLEETGEAFGCDLYAYPGSEAPRRKLERCETAFEGVIGDRRKAEGREWALVRLADGQDGWMPAPRMEDVAKVFPEFELLDIAVSFQHYLQYFELSLAAERQHRQMTRAVERFHRTPITPDNVAALATADVILGAADLLQGARELDRPLLDAASKRFALATQGLAYQSEAVNLHLMADLLDCCLERRGKVGANRIDATLSRLSRSDLESHAMRLWTFLKLDPASDTMLRNLATLLRMLQDEGEATFGGESVAGTLAKLTPLVAASASAKRDSSCEELKEQALAQAK